MKLPKRHRTCKTCGKVFCYESKDVKRCQSCREATATGIRRFLPRLMADQKGTCPICNKPLPEKISAEIHVDHRWPKDLGGTDDYENLQAVHTPCNREKKASIDQEGYKVVKKILHAVVDDSRISKRGPKMIASSFWMTTTGKRYADCGSTGKRCIWACSTRPGRRRGIESALLMISTPSLNRSRRLPNDTWRINHSQYHRKHVANGRRIVTDTPPTRQTPDQVEMHESCALDCIPSKWSKLSHEGSP